MIPFSFLLSTNMIRLLHTLLPSFRLFPRYTSLFSLPRSITTTPPSLATPSSPFSDLMARLSTVFGVARNSPVPTPLPVTPFLDTTKRKECIPGVIAAIHRELRPVFACEVKPVRKLEEGEGCAWPKDEHSTKLRIKQEEGEGKVARYVFFVVVAGFGETVLSEGTAKAFNIHPSDGPHVIFEIEGRPHEVRVSHNGFGILGFEDLDVLGEDFMVFNDAFAVTDDEKGTAELIFPN